jgi:hypothetical protein
MVVPHGRSNVCMRRKWEKFGDCDGQAAGFKENGVVNIAEKVPCCTVCTCEMKQRNSRSYMNAGSETKLYSFHREGAAPRLAAARIGTAFASRHVIITSASRPYHVIITSASRRKGV